MKKRRSEKRTKKMLKEDPLRKVEPPIQPNTPDWRSVMVSKSEKEAIIKKALELGKKIPGAKPGNLARA